jgi:hypothetical protein
MESRLLLTVYLIFTETKLVSRISNVSYRLKLSTNNTTHLEVRVYPFSYIHSSHRDQLAKSRRNAAEVLTTRHSTEVDKYA